MLNVGIIGLGVGEKHAQAFAAHPNCKVAALCDLNEDRLRQVGETHPEATLATQAEAILHDPDIHIVSVASYDDAHRDQVEAAFNNGKHVFVEKPICLFDDELRSIRAVMSQNPGLRLSSNLNLRTCPRFLRLKEMIDSGEMGDIFHMEADYLWGRVNKLTEGWRGDMDFYSIIHGASVHMIDLVLWATEKKPIKVQGLGNAISTRDTKMRFHDFSVLLIEFEDGMTAKVTGNGGCVHPHFHRVTTFGTNKTFVHEHAGAKLYQSRAPTESPIEVTEEYPGFSNKAEIVHTFADAILDPTVAPLVDEEAVFKTMSVCLAAQRAVDTGQPTTIEYI